MGAGSDGNRSPYDVTAPSRTHNICGNALRYGGSSLADSSAAENAVGHRGFGGLDGPRQSALIRTFDADGHLVG